MNTPICPSQPSDTSTKFAEAVIHIYSERLLRLARSRLGVTLQSKISAEDIVQSALISFLNAQPVPAVASTDESQLEDLWGLLVVITLRKCLKWQDIYYADKRSVRRERPLGSNSEDLDLSVPDLHSREPGPLDVAIVMDLTERLLSSFDERRREMIRLRLYGMEIVDIAQSLESSKRTVSRVIAEAKVKLKYLMEL